MSDKQQHTARLNVRADAAAMLDRLFAGRRDLLGVHKSTASRWCDGSCMSPLAYVALMLIGLPEAESAELLTWLTETHEDAHGSPETLTLEEALLAADRSDSADDNARMCAAIGGATVDELRALIPATYAQDHDSAALRRAARRELMRRDPAMRPMRPSAARREARAS